VEKALCQKRKLGKKIIAGLVLGGTDSLPKKVLRGVFRFGSRREEGKPGGGVKEGGKLTLAMSAAAGYRIIANLLSDVHETGGGTGS